jgi:hypothetical protein
MKISLILFFLALQSSHDLLYANGQINVIGKFFRELNFFLYN